jgi:hypothetical protein
MSRTNEEMLKFLEKGTEKFSKRSDAASGAKKAWSPTTL